MDGGDGRGWLDGVLYIYVLHSVGGYVEWTQREVIIVFNIMGVVGSGGGISGVILVGSR